MKIFISYRFTRENQKILKEELEFIRSGLKLTGHSYWVSLDRQGIFRRNNYTRKQILKYALRELDKSAAILAFVKSNRKSEGMLIEIGYALAKKKKFILAIRKGIKTTFLREIADKVIEFKSIKDLPRLLEKSL